MANLRITNKKTQNIKVRGISTYIAKLCTIPSNYPDVMYHDGENTYPIDGDLIYRRDFILNKYVLFTNNTAALPRHRYNTLTYITTDNNGVCTLHECN